MITKENFYKYKDKKLLRSWSKGELINFIFQLMELLEADYNYDDSTDLSQETLERLGL